MLQDKYNRLIIDKLPKEIAVEFEFIKTSTDNFSDEDLIEVYKDNFNELFKIVENKYQEALTPKKKLIKKAKSQVIKKATEKKKVVKKAEPKRVLKKKINCDEAVTQLKKIESKKALAIKAREEAPKKRATTAAKERQIKALSSLFKTKKFKDDKKRAKNFTDELVSLYSKYVSNEFANYLQTDIDVLIESKYKTE